MTITVDELLVPEMIDYFFGSEFNLEVAILSLKALENIDSIIYELNECMQKGIPHTGLVLTTFMNLDDGAFTCAVQSKPYDLSMVSFYISSNHRYFGGQSLICIPLQYLTPFMLFNGEYIVYRHTFKEPIVTPEKYQYTMSNGSTVDKLNIFTLSKSRDGFKTIPGKSYIGITQRSWQERYLEHTDKALKNSSSTLFHDTIREMQGKKVICVHDVTLFGASKEQAINTEKELIKKSTLYPNGLNMKIG